MVAQRKARLLIIEDNPGDVDLFRMALDRAQVDCDISVICDGGEAIDFFRHAASVPHETPDLVVLDFNLPKADGYEVLSQLRAAREFGEVPVVIWTSSKTPMAADALARLRIKRHIVKPSDLRGFMQLGEEIGQILKDVA